MIFRRRREFKTNYKRRKKVIMSKLPIVYAFKSNKNIWGQIIKPARAGDIVLVQANSKELEKLGWKFSRKNYPAAYLVGLLLGKRAVKKGIKDAILYTGVKGFVAKSKIAAFAKGVVDAGLNLRISEDVFPEEDVIRGERIVAYAKSLVQSGYSGPQFSVVIKEIEGLPKVFDEIKNKILGGEIE
ncbi:MAG: 50S ribosomal protein L18 [Nitrososphaeria archaeon]